MAGQLLLRRYGVSNVNYQWVGAFRIRIEVTDPNNSGADPNVFVYRRNTLNPYNQTTTDTFFAVASPVDLAEYAAGAPDPNSNFPFFRLSYVELDVRATSQAEEFWRIVVNEVNNLLLALVRLTELRVTEEVLLGDTPPGDSDSDSDSEA